MNFNSFTFIVFLLVSLHLYYFFRQSAARPYVLLLINAVFLASFSASLWQLTPLLAFLLLGYLGVKLVERYQSNAVLALLLVIVIFAFVFLKRYAFVSFLHFLQFPYVVVGLSYILFRVIHLLVDISGKAIKENLSFLEYVNYVCFFLNFVSGPIQRYQDFQKQQKNSITCELSQPEVAQAFSRIINGYIKTIFLAVVFSQLYQTYGVSFTAQDKITQNIGHFIIWFACAAAFYLFYLYCNFSGYMDIVIGFGKLFGFELPENFDHPFKAGNFLNLWSRWHITLSTWFRIYVFNPILKFLVYRWDSPAVAPYLGVIGFFITFFCMGVWHGTTLIFLIFGLFLGFGASVNKLYQVLMRKRWRGGYERLGRSPLYRYLCRGLTMSYFSVALTCFWLDWPQLYSLYGGRVLVIVAAGTVVLGAMAAAGLFCWDQAAGVTATVRQRGQAVFTTFIFQNSWLAAKCFFLAYLLLKFASAAPEYVYKAF